MSELTQKRLRTGKPYSIDSTGFLKGVLKKLSPRGGSTWSESLSPERNVPHMPDRRSSLRPPYKPQGLCYPRPGRSGTRGGEASVFKEEPLGVAWLPQAWDSQGLSSMSFLVDSSGKTPSTHLSSSPWGKTDFLFFPISNNI